jgi:ribulose-5-phosphate 4-epimerase/fuculose-1-phosphate aldolase
MIPRTTSTIHSAVHAARQDAHCVMHIHSVNGVAVSAQQDGLLPLSQQSLVVLKSLSYHDYEGVALSADEKPRLVKDLGNSSTLILRNHGLLTVGPTAAEAFVAMYLCEAACMIQVRAQSGDGKLRMIPQTILDGIKQQVTQVTKGTGFGALAWPGLLRRLDRRNPGYVD